MDHTHRIKLSRAPIEDDNVALWDIVRRALGLVAAGFLAAMLIGAGITIYVAVTSRATAEPRMEILAGTCKLSRSSEGSWWNDNYPTNIDLKSACGQIGWSDTPWKWRSWNAGYRVAYVNLGGYSTDSIMAVRDEDQFNNPPIDGSLCNHATGENCIMRTVGGGRTYGLTLGGVIEEDLAGFNMPAQPRSAFVLGYEAGLFLYHSYFAIDITPYPDPNAPVPYHESPHWDYARGWRISPYVGANIRYHWFILSGRAYSKITAHKMDCKGCSGVTDGPAYQVTAGFSIPF